MKPYRKFLVLAAAALCVTAGAGLAQHQAASSQVRGRGIEIEEDFNAKRVDGMRVFLKQYVNNQWVYASESQVFHTGDRIKVEFESNFDGYVYILNVDPAGQTCVLFPIPAERNNRVVIGRRYTMPFSEDKVFRFNNRVGEEVLQVFMSREPIPTFDEVTREAAANNKVFSCLSQSAVSAAHELSQGASGKGPQQTPAPDRGFNTKAIPAVKLQPDIRPRGVELYIAGKGDKGTVVAVTPNPQDKENGVLKKGDLAIYEVRLHHEEQRPQEK
jgi:hypothetical protein